MADRPTGGSGLQPTPSRIIAQPPALATSVAPPALDPSVPIRIQGRFGVDLVVYLAETSSGTLTTEQLSRTTGYSGFKTRTTTQHSLHLRLQPNATVTALLYPVTHAQSTPTFSKLDHDRVVKIASSYGTDYVFLGFTPFDFNQGNLAFHGQRGVVQVRADGARLSLSGKGRLQYQDHVLNNDQTTSKSELIGGAACYPAAGHPPARKLFASHLRPCRK